MGNEVNKVIEELASASLLGVVDDLVDNGITDKIWGLSEEAFMSLTATMVDGYGAANNMSSEDVLEMMDTLVSTMKQVHADLGGM